MSFHRLLPEHPTLCHPLSYKLHHPHKCRCRYRPSMCSNKNSTEATVPHNQHNGFSISRFWQVQWDVKDSVMKPWWLQRQLRRLRRDLPWFSCFDQQLQQIIQLVLYRCSLSCDSYDRLVIYSPKQSEHPSHIYRAFGCSWVFPFCFSWFFMLQPSWWQDIGAASEGVVQQRDGSALVLFAWGIVNSLKSQWMPSPPFTCFDSTWNLQDEGGKNWYAWYCLRHHFVLWSHNMMPTKYSGKGVDRSFHYSVIT